MIENLRDFFNVSEFALVASYTEKQYLHPSSNTIPVTGMLLNRYIDDNGISGTRPVFSCVASDVANAQRGDFITINNTDYLIDVPQYDGTGIVKILLKKQ